MGIKLTDQELEDLKENLPVSGEHVRYRWILSFGCYVPLAMKGMERGNFLRRRGPDCRWDKNTDKEVENVVFGHRWHGH